MNREYNNNREYNTALEGLRFSEEAKARMVQGLLDAQLQPETRRIHRRIPRLAAVGVAAALVLTAGAGASGALKTAGEAFADVFGSSAAETEIIDKIGYPIGASDTSNGVTMTADAIIGDKYHYAITYTLEKEDGSPFDIDLTKIAGTNIFPLGFEDWDTDIGFFGGMHGSAYFYDADPADNAIQYVEMMETDGEIPHRTAKAHFKNLCVMGENGRQTIAEGSWKLKFDMNFEDTSVSLSGGQAFKLNGMDAVIDAVTLSPVALRVDYTVDSAVEWDENAQSGQVSDHDREQTHRYFDSVEILLTQKDGTVVNMSNAGGSIKPENGKSVCQKGNMFDAVIPLEEVASITVCGVEIPVG